MDRMIIVSIVAAALIGLIVWWFFGKRTVTASQARQESGKQVAEITVDGGYSPSVIELKAGVPAELVFNRKDPSACFNEVILPDFGEKASLPVDQSYTLKINPEKPGEYSYSCGMHMFFGKVVVK